MGLLAGTSVLVIGLLVAAAATTLVVALLPAGLEVAFLLLAAGILLVTLY